MSGERWATGWYATRRHVIDEQAKPIADGAQRAACSRFTFLYPLGRGLRVPAVDSPEVMAIKPCGHCLRKSSTTPAPVPTRRTT